MSFSSSPSKHVCQGNAAAFVDGNKKQNRDAAETVRKCEDLLTNMESGFIAIMKDLMKKGSESVTDHLKVLLECSICKEIIHSAVSRQCLHTFCSDCLTQWTVSSEECPICRDDVICHVKNPIIDEVVNLLVDTTFTEKEKEERNNEIQQLSPRTASFETISNKNLQWEHPNTSLPGRAACAMMARSLLSETRAQYKLGGNDEDVSDILLGLHINMYNDDWELFPLVYVSIPDSVLSSSMLE